MISIRFLRQILLPHLQQLCITLIEYILIVCDQDFRREKIHAAIAVRICYCVTLVQK